MAILAAPNCGHLEADDGLGLVGLDNDLCDFGGLHEDSGDRQRSDAPADQACCLIGRERRDVGIDFPRSEAAKSRQMFTQCLPIAAAWIDVLKLTY